jgi:sulfite reductase (NADPH) flavoprotein alpha-component
MAIAALILPLFGITGWMLYLDRRRKKRLLRAERAALQETVTAPLRPGKISATGAAAATPQDSSPLLIAFASQAGQAEQLALKTAALMRQAGAEVTLQSLARLNPERLRHHHRILFIVSTFGEGDAPDSARAFAKRMQFESGEALAHVEYAMLALGDRNYVKFCGFGHTLDHWLRNRGAHAAFPMVEVDRMDKAALQVWQHGLSGWIGYRADSADAPHSAAEIDSDAFSVDLSDDGEAYSAWQLSERLLLNNGSLGQPIFHLELRPEDGHAAQWKSGALVEILPRHAPDRVEALLRRWQLDGEIGVTYAGRPCTLSAALARSVLPVTYHLEGDPRTQAQIVAQALTNSLQALSPRRYSIASIPQDGAVHLLVRQVSHEDGLGLASGWLTEYAPLGGALDLRILPNRSFELACAEHQETEDVADSAAAIFIGNGSGLAGLRSHLRERMRRGEPRNWLLFGERNRRFDYLYQAEIEQWQHSGMLERVDLAFSRDQTERIYVQDKLREAGDAIREWVRDGAVLYVCGSLDGMAAGVDAALEEVLGQSGVEDLIAANRYRRDVY